MNLAINAVSGDAFFVALGFCPAQKVQQGVAMAVLYDPPISCLF